MMPITIITIQLTCIASQLCLLCITSKKAKVLNELRERIKKILKEEIEAQKEMLSAEEIERKLEIIERI